MHLECGVDPLYFSHDEETEDLRSASDSKKEEALEEVVV